MARDASGRPFFNNREGQCGDTDFSISHSGDLAAVSLVKGKNLRTGCDVELVRPRARAKEIAEEFFTASESAYIESGGRSDWARFYHIWTLKECFLKLRGLSVFDMSSVPSFISGEGSLLSTRFGQISFSLYELTVAERERYILATAIEPQPSLTTYKRSGEGSPLEPQPSLTTYKWSDEGSPLEPQPSLTTCKWSDEGSPLECTEAEQPEIRWFSQYSLDCKSIAKIKAAPSPADTVSPKI